MTINTWKSFKSVICHVVLSNDALRPSRLERHLTTAHPMLKEIPKVFFAKKNSLIKIKLDSTGEFQQKNEKNCWSFLSHRLYGGA